MSALLAFIFVIGILVFFHELGHFLFAKWSGVRVEKFSLGFGKKLFGFTRGETEYIVCMLPLGGYVKMYGEGTEGNIIIENTPDSKGKLQSGDRIVEMENIDLKQYGKWEKVINTLNLTSSSDRNVKVERDGKIIETSVSLEEFEKIEAYTEKEYKRGFSNQSILNRFLIVIAGPAMNIIIPFFFMPIVFMVGISIPAYLEQAPEIGYVKPDSPAEIAGFEKGDRIVEIEGKAIENWRDVNISLQSNPGVDLDVKVRREETSKILSLNAEATSDGIVAVGFRKPLDAVVGGVSPDQPAARAGIQQGDRIVSINSNPVSNWDDMSEHIKTSGGETLNVVVERNNRTIDLQLKPEMSAQLEKYVIGIEPSIEEIVRKYGFFESVLQGIKEAATMTIEITVLFFGFLFKLFTGKIALGTAGKSIAGPLLIAKVSGTAAQSGLSNLLQFTSFISINLAIINLLPIPMLDGGHILYLLLEKIKRKPLNEKTMEISQRVGFTLLIFLMFIAIYNDISRMRGDIFNQIAKLMDLFQ